MAYEKQRKQDICVLAVSHEQCKTLSIVMVGTLEPNFDEVTPLPTTMNGDEGTAHHLLSWTQCPPVLSPFLTAHFHSYGMV